MAMAYQVEFTQRAAKELQKIRRGDPKLGEQLIAAIRALGEDPYPDGHVVLGGREGFRIRVRQHRVLYSVVDDRLVVEVFRIGPRGDAYK